MNELDKLDGEVAIMMSVKRARGMCTLVGLLILWAAMGWSGERPVVFPLPQQMQLRGAAFALDDAAVVLVPEQARAGDLDLAARLSAELAGRCGLGLATRRTAQPPAGRHCIIMGTLENPLVAQALSGADLARVRKLPAEGYLLRVERDRAIVAGRDEAGAFYGFQTLRQLIESDGGAGPQLRGAEIADWPHEPFRAVRLYVPGPENLAFFKRFLRDFVALYKFNKVVLEMNACMRLTRHPELNAGWLDFARDLAATRRERPEGPRGQNQDSAHYDAGDGAILEQADVAGLVACAAANHIEVIPEIPSLTHAYYLLTRHRELAEIQDAEWPDTYCPSNPAVYPLLFDVLDEYLDVMRPKMVHAGHDEWRMPVGVCPRCQGRDQGELFARDVRRIHEHLAARGVKMALWGDHLLENVRGKGPQRKKSPAGYEYRVPGGLTAQQVRDLIPKDILIFNWFWNARESQPTVIMGEVDDKLLAGFGFQQVYGNFGPEIEDYTRRSAAPGVIGGAVSSWAATTEFNIGKDLAYEFLGCANRLWASQWPDEGKLVEMVQGLMPEVRRNLGGRLMPSEQADAVQPVELRAALNVGASEKLAGADLNGIAGGTVAVGKKTFRLADPARNEGRCAVAVASGPRGKTQALPAAGAIPVGVDASSLIFLHGCARPAGTTMSYKAIYNFDDTADLLGWYDVAYEDGFHATVPIRYAVNILAWQAGPSGGSRGWVYGADPVACSRPGQDPAKKFYAFEWVNPRPGKVIKEVRLCGATGFRNTQGQEIPGNAVALVALSVVEQRRDLEAVAALPRAAHLSVFSGAEKGRAARNED